MQRYPHIAGALLLHPDAPSDTSVLSIERSGRLQIHYQLDAEQVTRFRQSVEAAVRVYLAAGAQEVLVPQTSTAIVKAGEVRRSEGGQEKPVSTADQQVYLATCELIAGIVSGRSLSSSSMHVTYTRKPEGLVVDLSPTDARMAKRMKSVQLVFAEEDLHLKELRMEQVNGDRTITRFSLSLIHISEPTRPY